MDRPGFNQLSYRAGDVVAIIDTDELGAPFLGIHMDKARHKPYGQVIIHPLELARIPTRTERSDLEFLDNWTPIFYYGE